MTNAVDTDDFLEHFGVKGMKWGKHTAGEPGGGGGSSRSAQRAEKKANRTRLKELDKASLRKDLDKHASEVDAARERYNTTSRQKYLDAKAQYKVDKATIGKREAAKAFQKVKDENLADYEKSQEFRDGKEAAVGLIAAGVGVVALAAIQSALKG